MKHKRLTRLRRAFSRTRHTTKYNGLSVEEQLLLRCYNRLDERDRKDLLCFLFEKTSRLR